MRRRRFVTDGSFFTSHHITPGVIELLSSVRVRVAGVTFEPPPHTAQVFQVLDLTLFGVLKRRDQSQFPLEEDAGSARFMKKIDHDDDFRMTMTIIEPNVWRAFRGIQVNYSLVEGVQRVSLDEMTVRESEGEGPVGH
jgi:hypothetical protein